MPKSKQQKPKASGVVMPPLSVSDRIDSLLKEHLAIFPSKGELTDEEIQHWHKDLAPFSLVAIEWAFDNWRRSGLFFPLYGAILDMCVSYEPPQTAAHSCDAICHARHGKGYNTNDMLWLFAKMQQAYATGDVPDTEALMTQLDAKRHGGAPEWRKSDL